MEAKTPDVKQAFDRIMIAWENNVSHSDIYHMILEWIAKYKDKIKDQDAIDEILVRMSDNEPTNEIVEDFIYGYWYSKLRKQFQASG
jgi:protoporphyrinogen oxidase